MVLERLEMTPVQMTADNLRMVQKQGKETPVKSFGEFLLDELNETNRLQVESEHMRSLLAAGEVDDAADVMIAAQKADIALNLTLQIRNRLLDGFQELSRMQI